MTSNYLCEILPWSSIQDEKEYFGFLNSNKPIAISSYKSRNFEPKLLSHAGLVLLRISYRFQRKRMFSSDDNAIARNTHISQQS